MEYKRGLVLIGEICLILCTVFDQIMAQDIIFHLLEQKQSGTLVGNVATASGVAEDVSDAEFRNLVYSFLNPSNLETAALFSINSQTGAIYTTAMIDRERICKLSLLCEIEFDVTIQSTTTTFLKLLTVKIVIDDVNDNQPLFPNNEATLYIPEAVTPGSKFRIDGASDKDTGKSNSLLSYRLVSSSTRFSVDAEEKLDGSSDVRITVLKALDREKRDSYTLYIVATDSGTPPLSGTLTLHINVTDNNDNVPVFRKPNYNINVAENTAIRSKIGSIEATDRDIGDNGKVSYRFSPLRSSKLEELLSLDKLTGALTVKSPLQYESGKTYDTIVEATDSGNPPQVSQTTLVVNIIDVGNNPPQVQLNLASPVNNNTVLLSENSRVGTFVGHIKVDDRDPGDNGKVSCSVEDPKFGVQNLAGKGYALLLNKPLDREGQTQHNVRVVCEDSGSPKLSSSTSFVVMVTDENDNAPVFQKSTYYANVSEKAAKGTFVIKVSATDPDLGVNSHFIYRLSWDADSLFEVDPDTGVITTVGEYDRETTPKMTFTAKAIDQGRTALIGIATVVINIVDENDNTPIIKEESLRLRVLENLHSGSVVGKIEATDADVGDNGKLIFLPRESNPSIPFAVFNDGVIRTDRVLDRETKSHYEFDIVVQDNGREPRKATGHVVVDIIDDNDHTPTIEFPASDNRSVIVTSDLHAGDTITKIIAYDGDEGDNAELTYSIDGGNDGNLFDISPKTGIVFLTRIINLRDKEFYMLKISVRDHGAKQRESRDVLNIKVIFTNATLAANRQNSAGQKYIIIAGIVAGVTVILSIIIVAIILRIRQSDQRNRHGETVGIQEEGDPQNFRKGKVENNFSKPITLATSDSDHGFHIFPNPKMEKDPKFSFGKEEKDNFDSKLPSEQYNKPDFVTFQKIKERSVSFDVRSDLSGETTASDSGRGGSEDDAPQKIRNNMGYTMCPSTGSDDEVPPPTIAARQQKSNVQRVSPIIMDDRNSIPMTQFSNTHPVKDNRTRKDPYRKFTGYKEPIPNSKSYQTPYQTHNSRDWLHPRPHNTKLKSPSYNSLPRSPDDDDCSTTSGSYTVMSDDADTMCVR
ncbi:protocadherin-9 [Patella vulgata]|uniref:protocadherin-9 n=1 Tax=Patella vulgata TaxID=6465 RepID=UPI0021800336|nr:protocadherin-9 [Patella vulgata]XP_050416616.1 protocadherin-9 [Patella vulgata]XP_050416617.1 protocadherin-9 [Patella vulgata]XP_050416618.1 protocadherin-9 [Patella vulgata]